MPQHCFTHPSLKAAHSEEHLPSHTSEDKETVTGTAAWNSIAKTNFAGDALSWKPFGQQQLTPTQPFH